MVERGNGPNYLREYRWVQQPNGLFTIFDVEIFMVHRREIILEDGEVYVIDVKAEDLPKIIENHQARVKQGYWPPVHIGHHDEGVENKTFAGHLDNPNINGNTIFADIVDIPEEVFAVMLQGKYRYRSPEYDDQKFEILTLALLESQPPYFKEFPILVLAKTPVKMTSEYSDYSRKRINYQEKIMFKFRSKKYQEEDPPKPKPSEDPNVDYEGDGEDPETKEEEMPQYMKYMDEGIKSLGSKMDQLCALLQKLIPNGDGGGSSGAVPPSSVAPVAMHDKRKRISYSKSNKLVLERLKKVEEAKVNEKINDYLRGVCDSKKLNYNAEKKFVSTLPARAKLQYIKKLENDAAYYSNYAGDSLNRVTFNADNVVKKYRGESPKIQRYAKELCEVYEASVQAHGKEFTRFWKSQKDFVAHFVENEKEAPGFIAKNLQLA